MMETIGPSLHVRATRSETLTPAEEAALHVWYAQEDQTELRNQIRQRAGFACAYCGISQIAA